MNVYLLTVSISKCGYDQYSAFIIRAESPDEAREMAQKVVWKSTEYRERHPEWQDPTITTLALGTWGDAEIICSSYHAGNA